MSDAAWFAVIFGGLFVLRVVAATLAFLVLLPQTVRCINCDEPTVRLRSPWLDRFAPWFRKSWCLRCGWVGLLRAGAPESSEVPSPATAQRR